MRGCWRWFAFLALCVISATAWIAETVWPSALPFPSRFCLEDGVLCLLLLPFAGKGWRQSSFRHWLKIALWGAALLAGPTLIAASAAPAVSAVAASLIFTAIPVVVILVAAESEAGFGAGAGARPQVGTALAGVAGALLILPLTLPDSRAGIGWLGAMVLAMVLSGVAIVKLHRLLAAAPLNSCLAAICGASSLGGLGFALSQGRWPTRLNGADWGHETALFLLVDAPLWGLTVGLVRDLEPRRFCSIYILTPLLVVVEGVVIVRPSLTWTFFAGVALMAFAAWGLLSPDDSPDAPLV